jgi:zinc protease
MLLAFFLFLQVIPQLPIPELQPAAGEIVGPYIFREDVGQTTKVILKNGLTVLVREENAVPLTSITALVKVGYFDEPDRISGISHVIEHMLFKGTSTRPVGQIAKETKGIGGQLNAYTYYDRTVYHTVVPSRNASAAMDIQSDALWNSTFDAAELDREIGVVLEENNRKLDNPRAVVSERLYSTAFRQHRIQRWRIGSRQGLRALSRDDVVDFHTRYYQPSNIVLAVVGQFERESMLEQIILHYGDREDTAVERNASPAEAGQTSFRYAWERGNIEQTRVSLGYHVPDALSDDAYALEVMSAVLSAGRASRMNRFLRDERGLISRASSTFLGFGDLGYFELDLETDDPVQAEIAMLAELENIKEFGITTEELERAKALIAQQYFHRLETVGGIAAEIAGNEALGDWKRINAFVAGIEDVSLADIQRISTAYFTTANLGLFEYLPASTTRSYSDDDFTSNVLAHVSRAVVERSVDELPVSVQVPHLDVELIQDMVKPIVRRSILRGPDVYILEDHRLPLVSFGIFYPGGRLYETASNAGITELTLRTALRGTRRYNTADVGRRLENAGARIQVVNEPDFFGYVLDGVSGQMDQALKILMEVLQEPTFPEEEVDLTRKLQVARIRAIREDTYRYPMQLFMSTVFEGHAYSRPGVGSEASIQSLTREDLSEWYSLHQRPLIPSIVIVGDTRGTGLVASIADALTNLDLHNEDITILPVPNFNPDSVERIEDASGAQTALAYGFLGTTNSHPDRFAMKVIVNAVSGLGGRFFETIREEQGLAYAVRAAELSLARAGAFFTYSAFSPENEGKVRAALEQEITTLIDHGLTEEELQKSIEYSIGLHEIRLQTRLGRVLAFARALNSGNGVQSVLDYSASIRNVTLREVQSVAARYLSLSSAKIAILRGKQ